MGVDDAIDAAKETCMEMHIVAVRAHALPAARVNTCSLLLLLLLQLLLLVVVVVLLLLMPPIIALEPTEEGNIERVDEEAPAVVPVGIRGNAAAAYE